MALEDHETGGMMKIASWNVNSIRARIDHVTEWLKLHQPDVLLMQELKAAEFPALVFQALGYESAAVTQKAYNGVAVLSRYPIETLHTTLAGDQAELEASLVGDGGPPDSLLRCLLDADEVGKEAWRQPLAGRLGEVDAVAAAEVDAVDVLVEVVARRRQRAEVEGGDRHRERDILDRLASVRLHQPV